MDYYKYKVMDEQLPQGQQPQMSHFSTPSYFTQQAIRAGYVAPHFENNLDHVQRQPSSTREAIVREIEKERIREEIIAEEIARRRMLKCDVRRELMMERQLSNQIGEGFSPFSSPPPPFLKQQSDDVTFVEERISRSQIGRGIGRVDIAPFEERIFRDSFSSTKLL